MHVYIWVHCPKIQIPPEQTGCENIIIYVEQGTGNSKTNKCIGGDPKYERSTPCRRPSEEYQPTSS